MTRIVINACYGGFGVSQKALHWMRERGHPLALKETDIGERWPDTNKLREKFLDSFLTQIPRDDELLVQVVETLGKEASANYANLKIVEIPDGVEWDIEDYDGSETVAERHQTWS